MSAALLDRRPPSGTTPREELRFWSAVWSIMCQLSRRLRRNARAAGLTPPQIWILQTVHAFGPLASSELAHELDVALPSLTSAVNHLERMGFLRRSRPPGDRRKVVISISPAGGRKLRRLWDLQRVEDRKVAELLTPKERAELATLLERFAARLAEGDTSRGNPFGIPWRKEADAG